MNEVETGIPDGITGEDVEVYNTRIFGTFVREPELLQKVARIFAESIDLAHEINRAGWVLTHEQKKSYIRLNVGRVFALTLRAGSLSVLFDEDALKASGVDHEFWQSPPGEEDEFRSLPGATWRQGPIEEVVAAWNRLREAHLSPLRHAAGQVGRTPYFRHHRSELVQELSDLVDRQLPPPDYGETNEPNSLNLALARRFMELRAGEDKDGQEIRGHSKDHEAKSERWRAIVAWEKVNRAELRKALEDTDFILGANKKMVLEWASDDEKAQKLLDAIKAVVGNPPESPEELRHVAEQVLPKGFSYGFLTEVLTYVDPDRFWELNNPVREAVKLVGFRGFDELKHGEKDESHRYFALRPLMDGLRSSLDLAGLAGASYLDVDLLLYEIGRKPENFPMLPIVIDQDALEALIADLRSWHSDFTTFDDRKGSWWPDEREYKEQLIDLFREQLLSSVLQDVGDKEWAVDVVGRIHSVLTTRLPAGLVQNLLGWRFLAFLKPLQADPEQAHRFASAVRELLFGSSPSEERIDAFNPEFVAVLEAIGEAPSPALTRSFPTLLLMLFDPVDEFYIRTNEFNDVFKILTGRTFFGKGYLTGEEYGRVRSAARALFDELAARGMRPLDMVDVQGFLHKVMARNTWILQANASIWDINQFLEDGHRRVAWTLPKMADEVRENDTVYFWVSGEDRGIVAQGATVAEAQQRSEIPDEVWEIDQRYYAEGQSGPKAGKYALVDVERAFPEKRILAERLKQHPVLKDLTILKQAAGTVFRVNKPQAVALYQMIRGGLVKNGEKPVTFQRILDGLKARGLYFPDELVANYLLALQTKRFVILTGISGTGKTQLAMSVAEEFPAPRTSRPKAAAVASGPGTIRVAPYMLKYSRFVVPVDISRVLEWSELSGGGASGRIAVEFEGEWADQAFYWDEARNVVTVLLSGDLKRAFLSSCELGEQLTLIPYEEPDGHYRALKIEKKAAKEEEGATVDNALITAVRPDWTDHRGLLGYFNPLTGRYVLTPFLELVMAARDEHERAQVEGRAAAPFFAVLDEMNLARVEHYFSDLLSCMESGKAIHLHDDDAVAAGETEDGLVVPKDLEIPPNLFIVGTVNVDETTYMFSPKVLDRAFTIELNEVDLGGYAAGAFGDTRGEISLPKFEGLAGEWKKPGTEDWRELGELDGRSYQAWVVELNSLLEVDGRHFGYRVADEIARFVTLAAEQSGGDDEAVLAAFDLAVLEKVLPKMNGTLQELNGPVERLFRFALDPDEPSGGRSPLDLEMSSGGFVPKQKVGGASGEVDSPVSQAIDPVLPRTARKLWRMALRLKQRGFASYIE